MLTKLIILAVYFQLAISGGNYALAPQPQPALSDYSTLPSAAIESFSEPVTDSSALAAPPCDQATAPASSYLNTVVESPAPPAGYPSPMVRRMLAARRAAAAKKVVAKKVVAAKRVVAKKVVAARKVVAKRVVVARKAAAVKRVLRH